MSELINKQGVRIAGILFSKVTVTGVLNQIEDAVRRGERGRQIVTINADILLQTQRDSELLRIIQDAWMNTADGMPIVWLSHMIRNELPERVTGADLTLELCREGKRRGLGLFFLGAAPGVAEKARDIVARTIPGADIRGVYSPTAGELVDPDMSMRIVEQINRSGANVLLVALGAPKQEKWIHQYKQDLDVSVSVGVGASIDFLAGTIPRAPQWMQTAGLEWIYRFAQEPSRLGKRYLRDTSFIMLAVREYLKAHRRTGS